MSNSPQVLRRQTHTQRGLTEFVMCRKDGTARLGLCPRGVSSSSLLLSPSRSRSVAHRVLPGEPHLPCICLSAPLCDWRMHPFKQQRPSMGEMHLLAPSSFRRSGTFSTGFRRAKHSHGIVHQFGLQLELMSCLRFNLASRLCPGWPAAQP